MYDALSVRSWTAEEVMIGRIECLNENKFRVPVKKRAARFTIKLSLRLSLRYRRRQAIHRINAEARLHSSQMWVTQVVNGTLLCKVSMLLDGSLRRDKLVWLMHR